MRAAVESASRLALDANSETFLKLAREVFGRDQDSREGDAQGARDRHRATGRTHQEGAAQAGRTVAGTAARAARVTWQDFRPDRKSRRRCRISCNARRAICPPRCAAPKCAAAGARSRCAAWWSSRACRNTAISQEQPVVPGESGMLRPDLLVRMPESRTHRRGRQDTARRLPRRRRGAGRRVAPRRAAPSRHAGGAARARARAEELLGTVRAQPRIRGAVPAGRSVPVRRAGGEFRAHRDRRSGSASS